MSKIRIGIIGVGNCASALVQGIEYFKKHGNKNISGLMNWKIGEYTPSDIEVCLAYDVDIRKVGKRLLKAIFEKPNCTKVFYPCREESGCIVKMGRVEDSIAEHLKNYPEENRFVVSPKESKNKEEIVREIKESKIDILLNYLPVGSEAATKFYVECALEAGVGFINNIPVFIASDKEWSKRFEERNLPIIGDDVKSQFGATIVHRTLVELCKKRGINIKRSYQLNTGGNTDFLNMLDRTRLKSKKVSKTQAVQSIGDIENHAYNLHVGPSDYIPWLKDNKLCFIRIEGEMFGGTPFDLELRLSVEDSPNSGGVVIDAIRYCKLALDNKVGGTLEIPSAYFCKHPIKQMMDSKAYELLKDYMGK